MNAKVPTWKFVLVCLWIYAAITISVQVESFWLAVLIGSSSGVSFAILYGWVQDTERRAYRAIVAALARQGHS